MNHELINLFADLLKTDHDTALAQMLDYFDEVMQNDSQFLPRFRDNLVSLGYEHFELPEEYAF
jgi:hypothetical protein